MEPSLNHFCARPTENSVNISYFRAGWTLLKMPTFKYTFAKEKRLHKEGVFLIMKFFCDNGNDIIRPISMSIIFFNDGQG